MSEADSNKKEAPQTPVGKAQPATDSAPAGTAKPAAAKPATKPGKGLAALALAVGLGGLLLGGYAYWQLQQVAERESRQAQAAQSAVDQVERFAEQNRQLAERLGRLEQLPSAEEFDERRRLLAALQSDQQRLSDRVEQVLGASREEWRLAEAEHLLRMAMLQLSAMQDVKSAEMLVHEADLILQKQDDPRAYATRQKLLEGLEALRSLPQLDRTGLFLQLGALRGQTARLDALAPEFAVGEAATADSSRSQWQRWTDELSRYIRVDLDSETEVRPLLAGQSLAQVRLALSLAIEQAQWAVLNGNSEVYRQSLAQAQEMLAGYFNEDNGQASGLRRRLGELAGQPVEVSLPDLAPALEALQRYVEKRQRADEAQPGQQPVEPAPEAPQESSEPEEQPA